MTPRPPLVCCRRGITAAHEKSKIKSACYRSANGRAAAFPSEIKVSSRTNQAWLKAFGGGKAHPSGPRRMERAMQIDSVRRLCNGVIDIDSYRREALILRRQTGVKFFRSIGRSKLAIRRRNGDYRRFRSRAASDASHVGRSRGARGDCRAR